jgi:Fur family zinc uptake transcriptional regulator
MAQRQPTPTHHHRGEPLQDDPPPADPVLARAERLCAERRLAFTASRRRVLELLAASPAAPLGAYDLAELLRTEDGRRMAPVQVYRALEFLQGLGLVHRIATRNAYLACDHGHGPEDTVMFLVCQSCGNVTEACAPEGFERGLKGAATAAGFQAIHPVVEVEGECASCRERA